MFSVLFFYSLTVIRYLDSTQAIGQRNQGRKTSRWDKVFLHSDADSLKHLTAKRLKVLEGAFSKPIDVPQSLVGSTNEFPHFLTKKGITGSHKKRFGVL